VRRIGLALCSAVLAGAAFFPPPAVAASPPPGGCHGHDRYQWSDGQGGWYECRGGIPQHHGCPPGQKRHSAGDAHGYCSS
jgi:hypothetical protein